MNKKKIIIALLIAVALFFIIKKFMNKEEEETTGGETANKSVSGGGGGTSAGTSSAQSEALQVGGGRGNAVEQGATGKGSIINAAPQKEVLIGQNNTPGQAEIRRSTPGIVRKKTNRNALLGKL